MAYISIRDLQKMSSETIAALPGPTPVKSGDRTIAILTPVRKPDLAKLEAAARRAEELAKERDPKEDDALLAQFGDVDLTDWSIEAVKKFMAAKD